MNIDTNVYERLIKIIEHEKNVLVEKNPEKMDSSEISEAKGAIDVLSRISTALMKMMWQDAEAMLKK